MWLMPESKRQKILIITRNLPHLVGGMERLNWHMADELSKYTDVRVIGPSGSAATPSQPSRPRPGAGGSIAGSRTGG